MTAKSKPSQRGRILIVEDDRDMAALLKSSLCYEGFRCDTAHSIEETKTKLEQYSYDAVLLDLFLGEESGLEFLPYITNRSPFSKVIVIWTRCFTDPRIAAFEFRGNIEEIVGLFEFWGQKCHQPLFLIALAAVLRLKSLLLTRMVLFVGFVDCRVTMAVSNCMRLCRIFGLCCFLQRRHDTTLPQH